MTKNNAFNSFTAECGLDGVIHGADKDGCVGFKICSGVPPTKHIDKEGQTLVAVHKGGCSVNPKGERNGNTLRCTDSFLFQLPAKFDLGPYWCQLYHGRYHTKTEY